MVRTIGRYAGLHFEEETYPYLQEIHGGHPYLIRIACSVVWKASDTRNPEKLTSIKIESFRQLRLQIRARLAQPIKDILLSLVWWYPDEYDVLRILASGDKEFVKDYLKQEPAQIIQFAKYGILRGDTGEFAIADVKDFLNQFGELYKREISPFMRTDMPPELLPEMPDLSRLGKLFEKRCEAEGKLRKLIMLYLGVKHSWDPEKIAKAMIKGLRKLSERPNPSELFVGRTAQQVLQELYFSDLKTIMLENWDVFGNLFDNHKTRFEMNMDTLNKARRIEAHTRPVTQDEVVELENSYTWLNNRIAKVPSITSFSEPHQKPTNTPALHTSRHLTGLCARSIDSRGARLPPIQTIAIDCSKGFDNLEALVANNFARSVCGARRPSALFVHQLILRILKNSEDPSRRTEFAMHLIVESKR